MKNILIVTPLYFPSVGGASTYFKEYVVDNLSKDFNMYVLTKTPAYSKHGEVYAIPSGKTVSPVMYKIIFVWDAFASFIYASVLIVTKNINAVHTHTSTGLCFGSSLAAKVFRVGLIKDLSDILSSKVNIVFPAPDRLICLKGSCEKYARYCGINSSLIIITLLPFNKNLAPKSKLSIQKNEKYFFYAGEIKNNKGVDKIATLAKQLPTYQFILAGPKSDARVTADLLKIHNVTVLPPLRHTKVLTYMKHAQALLQPSNSEGIPRVVVEALTTKTPIICKKGAAWTTIFRNTPGIYFSDFNPLSFQKLVMNHTRNTIPPHAYRRFTVSKIKYRRFLSDVYKRVLR